MTCDHCGAVIKDAGAFCSHCGTRLVRPERTEPAIRAATDPARYDLARASQAYQVALGHVPKISHGGIGLVVPILLIGFAIFFIVQATNMGAVTDHPVGFMFIVVPVIMMLIAGKLILSSLSFAKAPITNELVVVVDERTATSGGRETSVATHYYATVQTRDGARAEYSTYGWIAGRIAPGDLGVAFFKGRHLVDFLRLDA
jgi:hypothetical protein